MRITAATVTLCMLLQLALPARAQDPCDSLEDREARREYRQSCITLELVDVGESVAGPFGMSEHTTWTKWKAFRGYDPILEADVLRLCGQFDRAEMVAKARKKDLSNRMLGTVLAICGLVTVLVGATQTKEEDYGYYSLVVRDPNWAMICIGVGIEFAGIGIGLAAAKKLRQNYTPYGQVRMLADEYNDDLCERLAH